MNSYLYKSKLNFSGMKYIQKILLSLKMLTIEPLEVLLKFHKNYLNQNNNKKISNKYFQPTIVTFAINIPYKKLLIRRDYSEFGKNQNDLLLPFQG